MISNAERLIPEAGLTMKVTRRFSVMALSFLSLPTTQDSLGFQASALWGAFS